MLRSQKGHEMLFPVPLDTLIAIMLHLIAILHKLNMHCLQNIKKTIFFFTAGKQVIENPH